MNRRDATQEEIKKLVHYNPETGVFIRLVTTSVRGMAGETLGRNINVRYQAAQVGGYRFHLHQLAFLYMAGYIPDCIDHINHNRYDNRWCNLAESTHIDNTRNQKLHRTNKTGITGVRWDKSGNRWVASIYDKSQHIYLGSHKNKFDACCARKSAERTLGYHENHGKPAPLEAAMMEVEK